MSYLLISGALTDECLNSILKISDSRELLKQYAEKYVAANPNTQLHIFSWELGFESKSEVRVDRLWGSGYSPAPQLAPDQGVDPA